VDRNLSKSLDADAKALVPAGLYKAEQVLTSPQLAHVRLANGDDGEVINFCANNYLGLSNHPKLIAAAKEALDQWGYGMSSVRFICGTQDIHKKLEQRIAEFLGFEDVVLYSSCFDANTGLFETILDERDTIFSDALNHASVIDGIRLCKARRLIYANNDMDALEAHLAAAGDARYRLIVTDGVFSMDGVLADLPAICDLAERYDALVMVDDSHGIGVLGDRGAGAIDHWQVGNRVDIVTGTLGKALGGASGGFTATSKAIATWLRQRSRPYLFSNSLAPVIAATSIAALDLLAAEPNLRTRLATNTRYFRGELADAGFELSGASHPIIPILVGKAEIAQQMASDLLARGIFVVGFSFPVVPEGAARIRTQVSAAHSTQDIDRALAAFIDVGREVGLVR